MLYIICCDKQTLDKIIEENKVDKLAEKSIKNLMKETKGAIENQKEKIKDMIEKKRIDIKEISDIWLIKKGYSSDYDLTEAHKILDKEEYPLSFTYLQKGEHLIKREDIPKFIEELKKLKKKLIPIMEKNIRNHKYATNELKNEMLEILKKDKDPSGTSVGDVSYGKTYTGVYITLELAKFAEKHNLDMIITYTIYPHVHVPPRIKVYVLDFNSIKHAIENRDYEYFENLFEEVYKKEYLETLAREKTELLKGPLGGAIAKAIVGEAESRNYKSTGFIDEDQFACMAIEWYSKELGTGWNELTSKDLGQGDVRRFNPENAEKILKLLEQMKQNPKETADNVNRLLDENLSEEYEIDEKWITQILNQIIEVVKEAVNKNLELVICSTYE